MRMVYHTWEPDATRPKPSLSRSAEDGAMDSGPEKRRLAARLETLLGVPVSLTLTRNRVRMVSARRTGEGFRVRLHQMFIDAPEPVIRAVAGTIGGERDGHRRVIRGFVEANRHRIRKRNGPPGRPRRTVLRPEGRHVNLEEVLRGLSRTYFRGDLDCRITWGQRRRPGRRSLRLGSYDPGRRLIRIHPALDRSFVPPFVLEAVVFHEALHHVLGIVRRNGRNHAHTAAFRSMERAFPEKERAERWLKENLERLRWPAGLRS